MSLLLISVIVGLLIKTLTADNKYSLCNSENLRQTIHMHLSNKQ